MSAAGAGLVQEVQEHIEELRPVGADVTVASVTEKAINVSAGIKVRTGTNLGTVEHAFQAAMAGYLRKEALDLSYVSLAKIGNLLLGIDGVEDYFDLLLNGDTGNVSLNDEELAVPGGNYAGGGTMNVSTFYEKLNKVDGNVYVVEKWFSHGGCVRGGLAA